MSVEEAKKPFLLIAAEEWLPWTKINTLNDGNFSISGPMGNILDILSTLLHFNYKIIRPENRLWGGLDASGNWTGMMGMLQRREVEFALGPLTVSVQRDTICDFSDALDESSYVILQARPTLQRDMSGFLKPFSLEVWISVFTSMVCICIAMLLVASAEGHIFRLPPIDYPSKAFLWVLQTFAQESSEWIPKMAGGRFLVTTWLLASLVFMSSYSGILTAMLAVPKAPVPIDSLEDLVSQNNMPWKMGQGFLLQYFKESDGKLQKEAYERTFGILSDCWGIRQNVIDGEFAVMCEKAIVMKIIDWDFSNSATCHSYKSREDVYGGGVLAMAFKTKSDYLPKVNGVIASLKEAGLLKKWLGEHIVNATHCLKPLSSDQTQDTRALDIEILAGPFIFLVGGLYIALLMFACEVVRDKIRGT